MEKRIEWIDIAKGIGILLVIFGHTISLTWSRPVYTFHLPLFFLLSGLVFHTDKYDSFIGLCKAKTHQLLKPWIIVWLISLVVCLLIPQWREELDIRSIIAEFYTANTNNVQNSSLWYLPCLFFVFLLYYLLRTLFVKAKYNKIWMAIVIVLAIVFLYTASITQYICNKIPYGEFIPDGRLPFKIDTALVCLIFFSIGVNYKQELTNLVVNNKANKWSNLLIILITSIALCILVCYYNGWSNVNAMEYGKIRALFYPIAFYCIIAVLLISNKVSKNNSFFKRVLLFYGKNSLIIFVFQSLLIRLYLLFFNNIQGLDMHLYADNPGYHQIGSFVLVSFVLSPLVVKLFVFLRNKGIKLI